MTLREAVEGILMEETLTGEQVGRLTAKIMAIGKGKDLDIKHQIGPNGFHRLIINGEMSEWRPPTDIIRLGDFIATTDAYIDLLPQVGKVFQLRDKDIVTESVQSLS